MQTAAYIQYNPKLINLVDCCCSTGKLKSGYGLDNFCNRLLGPWHTEIHNALSDCKDTLALMIVLSVPLNTLVANSSKSSAQKKKDFCEWKDTNSISVSTVSKAEQHSWKRDYSSYGHDEYIKESKMGYDAFCSYLQWKYGLPIKPYMDMNGNRKYGRVNSRTKEGLVIHHVREDKADLLSDQMMALYYPYEYQLPKNLCYCNYVEHLLLHAQISKIRGHMMPGFKWISQDIMHFFRDEENLPEWQKSCYIAIHGSYQEAIHCMMSICKEFGPPYTLEELANTPALS